MRGRRHARYRGAAGHRHRGLALIDVIIGGVLLGIGMSVVVSLAARSLKAQTDGEKRLIAAWLADEFLNMVLIEGPVNYPKLYDNHGYCAYPFEEFEYDLSIDDQGLNAPFNVTATIRWPSGGGYQHIQVQTLISERGGEPYQPRAPLEPLDRDERWYEYENPEE